MTKQTMRGSIATNILVLFAGAFITMLILGLSSGILTTWVKDNLLSKLNNKVAVNPTPTPSVEPIATIKPSATPKPSETPEPSQKPTTKGGIVLGEQATATKKPVSISYTYATVVYEFKDKNSSNWQIRGNYDTRYESYIDFDAVSTGYDSKVTICLYSNNGLVKCESGKTAPAVYTYNYIVGGKKLVYEIVGDKNGPTMKFSGPWKNSQGQTCVSVYDISDNLTPTDRLTKSEQMDSGDWRDVHSEYCISGNQGDKHSYQVRVKDESGNETTSTLTFPIL